MKKSMMSTHRLLHMGVAVGLAVVCLALLLGLGLNGALEAHAGAAQDVTATTAALGQPQIGTMATTATATVGGTAAITGSGSVPGYGGVLVVAGTADVTTAITLTTNATPPISVTVTGSLPFAMTDYGSVTVIGGNLIPAASTVTGVVTIDEVIWVTGSSHYTQVIIEDVPVTGRLTISTPVSETSVVTATGFGPVHGQGSLSAVEQQTVLKTYLPLVMKTEIQVGFFDDFSSYAAGIWPQAVSGKCDVSYYNGHYRIKVKSGWTGSAMECVVITRSPALQPIGTIGIDARRTSNADYDLWYGLYFSTGANYTKDRWAVQVRPDRVPCDGSDRPYLWLNCLDNGNACWTNQYKCTTDIKIAKDEWNEIDITRDGDLARVYINGDDQISKTSGVHKSKGYFNLFAYSQDKAHDVVVEFDNFYAVPNVLIID